MIRGLLGKKLGMTQIFDQDGNLIPVTVIEAGPCYVLSLINSPHLKVKLGYKTVKESRLRKPELGFFKKVGVNPLRIIKEFESTDNKDYKVGQEIKLDIFKSGDFVNITGITIGKGFQGGVKRWNWAGGPGSHGSMQHRQVGSIGSTTDPGRTLVGHHMPGHMGAEKNTVENLRVMQVDTENGVLLVKGAVPGHKNCYLTINRSHKRVYQSLEVKKAVHAVKRNPMKVSKAKAIGKAK